MGILLKKLIRLGAIFYGLFWFPSLAFSTIIPPSIQLTVTQPGYTLTLPSNPTTGYSWFIQSYDAKLVQVIAHKYIPSSSKLIGAGGVEMFQFKALPIAFSRTQQTVIVMVYKRPWEKESVQQNSIVLEIKRGY